MHNLGKGGRGQYRWSGKLQPTIQLPTQQSPWDAGVVDLGAKKDEIALDHVLGLKPIFRGTAAVQARHPLGDNAFQPEIGRSLEELGTITVRMIAELDR